MKRLLPTAAATLAAAGSASAQIEIGFGSQPFGAVITNQYGLLTFSSSPGNHVTISGPPSNRFICPGPVDGPADCIEDIIIDFEGPVANLTFDTVLADVVGPVARFRATYGGGGTWTYDFYSTGEPVQTVELFRSLRDVTKLEIFSITDDPAENGIAFDNFSFTISSLGGATQQLPVTINALPYLSEHNNNLISGNGPVGSCNAFGSEVMDNAMWFRHVPERDATIEISVTVLDQFQPIAAVYADRPGGLDELACGNLDRPLMLRVPAEAGVPLLIQVGDFGILPAGGAFALDVREACRADVNGDGMINPNDFNAWIIAFNNQALTCDQNGDGQCSANDFNAWILNFNAGC